MKIPKWLKHRRISEKDCELVQAYFSYSGIKQFSNISEELLKNYGRHIRDLTILYRLLRILGLYGVCFSGRAEEYSLTSLASPKLIDIPACLDEKIYNFDFTPQILSHFELIGMTNIIQLHGVRVDTLALNTDIEINELIQQILKFGFSLAEEDCDLYGFYLPSSHANALKESLTPYLIEDSKYDVIEKTRYKFPNIQDLQFSERANNVLQDNNIHHFIELIKLDEMTLFSFNNCGQRTVDEIKGKLSDFGLSLGMNESIAATIFYEYSNARSLELKPFDQQQKHNVTLESLPTIQELNLSTRAENVLVRNNIYSVEQLLALNEIDLSSFKHCGKNTVKEILSILKKHNLELGNTSFLDNQNNINEHSIFNVFIKDIGLSIISRNFLLKHRIQTVQKLLDYDKKELRNLPGCSNSVIKDIKEVLFSKGLTYEDGYSITPQEEFLKHTISASNYLEFIFINDLNLSPDIESLLVENEILNLRQFSEGFQKIDSLEQLKPTINLIMQILGRLGLNADIGQLEARKGVEENLTAVDQLIHILTFLPNLIEIFIRLSDNDELTRSSVSVFLNPKNIRSVVIDSLCVKFNVEKSDVEVSLNKIKQQLLMQFLPRMINVLEECRLGIDNSIVLPCSNGCEKIKSSLYIVEFFCDILNLWVDTEHKNVWLISSSEISNYLEKAIRNYSLSLEENEISIENNAELLKTKLYPVYVQFTKLSDNDYDNFFNVFIKKYFQSKEPLRIKNEVLQKFLPHIYLLCLSDDFDEKLQSIDEKKRFVIQSRINKITLNELGDELGVTRERVRQIEVSAKKCLEELPFLNEYKLFIRSLEEFLSQRGGVFQYLSDVSLEKASDILSYLDKISETLHFDSIQIESKINILYADVFFEHFSTQIQAKLNQKQVLDEVMIEEAYIHSYIKFFKSDSFTDENRDLACDYYQKSRKILIDLLSLRIDIHIDASYIHISKKLDLRLLVIETFKELFPDGAYVFKDEQIIQQKLIEEIPELKEKHSRYLSSSIGYYPDKLLLWGKGYYIHVDNVKYEEEALLLAIDECKDILSTLNEFKIYLIFDRHKSLFIDACIPNAQALYSLIRLSNPEGIEFPKYPRIRNQNTTGEALSLTEQLEEYIYANGGPIQKSELQEQFCNRQGWNNHQLEQTLSRVDNALTWASGKIIHKDFLEVNQDALDELIDKIEKDLKDVSNHQMHLKRFKDKYGVLWREAVKPEISEVGMGSFLSKLSPTPFKISQGRYVYLKEQELQKRSLSEQVLSWCLEYGDFVTRDQIIVEFCDKLGHSEQTIMNQVFNLPLIQYGQGQYLHPVVCGLQTAEVEDEIGNKLQEELGILFDEAAKESAKQGNPHTRFEWIIDSWWDKKPELLDEKWWDKDFLAGVAKLFSDIDFALVFHEAYVPQKNDFNIWDLDDLIAYIIVKEFNDYKAPVDKLEKILRREGVILSGIPKREVFTKESSVELINDDSEVLLTRIGRERYWRQRNA